MARLVFAVLCRKAVIDKFSSAASLLEVVDGLSTTQRPEMGSTISAELNIMTSWARDVFGKEESEANCRCMLLYPDGTSGKTAVLSVNLSKAPRARNIFRFADLEYRGEGEYCFQIALASMKDAPEPEWREIFRLPFVVQVQPETAAPAIEKAVEAQT